MEYVVYKRFKEKGIDGRFNLPFGTVCEERGGYLSPRTVTAFAP